ncbi:YozE family protein [Carnobacterium divergens]|nr:YozE family protein [Carnobacterium divergens]ANZ99969.1 hypothetical protein BFC22_07590 [Carnobacterium divergens]MDO0873828.1 YozE family protein [Carnobacterium divergens]MDT1959137.1 YozE family protein [Carnobacterium divergens]MDT1975025.1 YozE family protein [Carnobacterium divergens]MDT1997377.1 YozE family protein [Carnobacterium divergens]
MRQSFFHFLMTERDPHKNDEVTKFANDVYLDVSFPKQSENYQEISDYLEFYGDYLSSMSVFDNAWERYLERNQTLSSSN